MRRVDLDGQAEDFTSHLERAEPGSALEECARWGLALVAELGAAREARRDLGRLRDDLDATRSLVAASRLGTILRAWDGAQP